MRIACVSGFAPIWKRYPPNVLDLEDGLTVGGGEENMLRCTVGLRALGHEVEAWHCGGAGVWRGVQFNCNEDPLYNRLVGEHWDAIVAWTSLRPMEYARPGVKRIYVCQLNDLSLWGDWSTVDCIVSPSLDHAHMLRNWEWRGRQAVVHNGVDADLYWEEGKKAPPAWEDRPLDVGYWSSPDRGLHHLLRAWPLVVKREPKARLHVFYEIKRLLDHIAVLPVNFYGERGQTLMHLMLEAMHDPSIIIHGSIPRRKLARFQKQCRVQAYFAETFGYCEGFSTSTCQGLAAGCSVIARPMDALPSLYTDGVNWADKNPMDRDYAEYCADLIVRALHDELPQQGAKRRSGIAIGSSYSWDTAAQQMDTVCRGEWLPAEFWKEKAA